MSYQLLVVLSVQVSMLTGAPLMVMPLPWMGQSAPQPLLQQQLMELQALQQLSAQPSVQMNNQPQPMIILLPKQETNPNFNAKERVKHNDNDHKIHTNTENEDDDLNSVIIDAAMELNEEHNEAPSHSQKAILLIPNARFSIGGIVSAIPWLPIEINVPDTISWVYNGIASGIGSIISIIGRPFQGAQSMQGEGMKSVLKQMQTKQNNLGPIIMMPIDGLVLPIQV